MDMLPVSVFHPAGALPLVPCPAKYMMIGSPFLTGTELPELVNRRRVGSARICVKMASRVARSLCSSTICFAGTFSSWCRYSYMDFASATAPVRLLMGGAA